MHVVLFLQLCGPLGGPSERRRRDCCSLQFYTTEQLLAFASCGHTLFATKFYLEKIKCMECVFDMINRA